MSVLEEAHGLHVALVDADGQVEGFAPFDPPSPAFGRRRWCGVELEARKHDFAVLIRDAPLGVLADHRTPALGDAPGVTFVVGMGAKRT